MRGWSALLHQTALKALAELERVDPDNVTAAMARLVFDTAEAEGVRPSGAPAGGAAETQRERFARRKVERLAEDRNAAELYTSGLSLVEVAKRCARSPGWVSAALNRQGIEARPKGPSSYTGTTNPERVERLRAMRAEGKTLEEMGAAENITRERVRQICARAGIDTSPRYEMNERQLQAVAEYLAGDSLGFVATKYETSPGTVRGWIMRAGHVPRRPQRKIPPETQAAADKAANLYRQGLKGSEIAEQLGLPNQQMIYRLLGIAGVRPNRNFGAGVQRQ